MIETDNDEVRIFRPEYWYRDARDVPLGTLMAYFPCVKFSHLLSEQVGIETRHESDPREENLHLGVCYRGVHYVHTVTVGYYYEPSMKVYGCDGFRCRTSGVTTVDRCGHMETKPYNVITTVRPFTWNVETRREFMRSAGLPIPFVDHVEYALKGILGLLFT